MFSPLQIVANMCRFSERDVLIIGLISVTITRLVSWYSDSMGKGKQQTGFECEN